MRSHLELPSGIDFLNNSFLGLDIDGRECWLQHGYELDIVESGTLGG